jgi:hypothetical protein
MTILDSSLIAYWDMETTISSWSTTVLKDLSRYWYNWTCYNWWTIVNCWWWSWPSFVDWNWKTWNAMSFDWVDDYIVLSNSITTWNTDWTVLLYASTLSSNSMSIISNKDSWPVCNLIWIGLWKVRYSHYLTSWLDNYWNLTINNNVNNFLTWRNRSNWTMDILVNWNIDWASFDSRIANNWPVNVIWKNWWSAYLNWTIDEVRIYNRALSDSEIQTLYNATK